MYHRQEPIISARKQPKQARSTGLVAAILEAATQVLTREGAHRFTIGRVAERAGVSVGSIYQYFPNKAAILFRLQSDEWRETTRLLCAILEEREKPPLDRLRALVVGFVRSECEEAEMRAALDDAAPLYRDAPEARDARAAADPILGAFMIEVLPDTSQGVRDTALDLIKTTLGAVGKRFSETRRTQTEIDAYADSMADMFCGYLEKIVGRNRH